jgi:hypothetical protein
VLSDLQLSYLRSIAKFVGGVLVAHGMLSGGDLTALMPAVEDLVGAAITIWGVYQSHKVHA